MISGFFYFFCANELLGFHAKMLDSTVGHGEVSPTQLGDVLEYAVTHTQRGALARMELTTPDSAASRIDFTVGIVRVEL